MKSIELSEEAYQDARRLAVAEGLQLADLLQRMIHHRLRKIRLHQAPPPPRIRPAVDAEHNEWRQELL
jgi:hypothetical protein